MASSVTTEERFAAESFHAWETSGKRKLGQLIAGGSLQMLLCWLWLAKARMAGSISVQHWQASHSSSDNSSWGLQLLRTSPLARLCTMQVANIKDYKEKLEAVLFWGLYVFHMKGCWSHWSCFSHQGSLNPTLLGAEELVWPVPAFPLPSFFMCLV